MVKKVSPPGGVKGYRLARSIAGGRGYRVGLFGADFHIRELVGKEVLAKLGPGFTPQGFQGVQCGYLPDSGYLRGKSFQWGFLCGGRGG